MPARGRASGAPRGRIQIVGLPSAPVAMKASLRPSGEMVGNSPSVVLAGAEISKRTISEAGGFSRAWMKDTVAASNANAAAMPGHSLPNRDSGGSGAGAPIDGSSLFCFDSAIRASPMACKRSLRSLTSVRSSSFRKYPGVHAGSADQSGSLFTTASRTSGVVAPANARWPLSIS